MQAPGAGYGLTQQEASPLVSEPRGAQTCQPHFQSAGEGVWKGQTDRVLAAGTQSKRWPAFAEFIDRLITETGRPVVLCPGPGTEVQEAHRDHPRTVILEGVGMGTYAALMRASALVVSNDTGPGHLAAAVEASLLSVLGPTEPGLWRPWGPTVQIERHWPRWPSVDEALTRAQQILRSPLPAPH